MQKEQYRKFNNEISMCINDLCKGIGDGIDMQNKIFALDLLKKQFIQLNYHNSMEKEIFEIAIEDLKIFIKNNDTNRMCIYYTYLNSLQINEV